MGTHIIIDCPGEKYCPKYGVEYKGNTIVEGKFLKGTVKEK